MLQVLTFSQLVTNIATSMQGAASVVLNFTVGSVFRAIAEAVSALTLWLQALILQVLALTRASTSQKTDLDSWMADFGLVRDAAVPATGNVTFSRFTPTQQAVIPIGTTIQTGDGTQNFTVTLDLTNGAYNSALSGYVIAPSTASLTLAVQATTAGSGGNVLANTINIITTPIVGVDTVTNSSAFTNGVDPETDTAFRARFVLYLASLSKSTKAAVAYAIASLQQNLNYTLTENQDYSGDTDDGFFYLVVDDGSGAPSETILNAVSSAVDSVRALTVRFAIFAPIVVNATVSMSITSATGYSHPTVVGNVGTAITGFLNSLPLNTNLPYTQLAAVAYSVAGVSNVSSVLLNGTTSDLTADQKTVIKAGTVTIS